VLLASSSRVVFFRSNRLLVADRYTATAACEHGSVELVLPACVPYDEALPLVRRALRAAEERVSLAVSVRTGGVFTATFERRGTHPHVCVVSVQLPAGVPRRRVLGLALFMALCAFGEAASVGNAARTTEIHLGSSSLSAAAYRAADLGTLAEQLERAADATADVARRVQQVLASPLMNAEVADARLRLAAAVQTAMCGNDEHVGYLTNPGPSASDAQRLSHMVVQRMLRTPLYALGALLPSDHANGQQVVAPNMAMQTLANVGDDSAARFVSSALAYIERDMQWAAFGAMVRSGVLDLAVVPVRLCVSVCVRVDDFSRHSRACSLWCTA
jgi:hypothetical protein